MFLKNIKVEFISLVRKGANKKTVIWKSADGEPNELCSVPISKTDDEKRLVYGIVYSPEEIDTDGDYTDSEQITKAAYEFMKAGIVGRIDKNHSFTPEDGAYVVESWIVKAGDPVFPNEKPGSWAVAIKVENDEIWKAVKDGDISGLSMGGVADKVQKEDDGSVSAFLSLIKRLIKHEDNEMDEKQVKKIAADAVKEAIEKQEKPISKEDLVGVVVESVKEIVKPIEERLEKIEKGTSGSGQDDDNLDDDGDFKSVADRIVKAYKGEA